MQPLRFAIYGNVHQARKSALVKKLLSCLEGHGAEVWIDRLFHEYLTKQLKLDVSPTGFIEGDRFIDLQGHEVETKTDYAVSMGGDGTFLHTATRIGDEGTPIIGVNTGRMGFLADVSGTDIETTISGIYRREYRVEERTVLGVNIDKGIGVNDEDSSYPYALNEVAVMKLDSSSMISIRVEVDGEYLTTYQADGLIVNTPTGSTGYALSVGGPIMSPKSNVIGIVPVAPHSLNVRPITICDTSEVRLTVESRNHQFLVALDGRSHTCSDDTKLVIQRAPYCVRVLKRKDSSFFSTLREKMMWGSDVRN